MYLGTYFLREPVWRAARFCKGLDCSANWYPTKWEKHHTLNKKKRERESEKVYIHSSRFRVQNLEKKLLLGNILQYMTMAKDTATEKSFWRESIIDKRFPYMMYFLSKVKVWGPTLRYHFCSFRKFFLWFF